MTLEPDFKKSKNDKQTFFLKTLSFIVIAQIMFFSFGLFHLGKFVTVDERRWMYDRIPKYWKGILNQRWKLTYVHPKPGITVTLISGTSLLTYPNPEQFMGKNKPSVTGETSMIEKFYTTLRLPIIFFNGIFCVFFFWIMRKITKNDNLSLWSTILILLSPVLIGMSQIVNADSLVWVFSTATILSFIGFLKTSEKKLAAFTSLFLGLSLLSKFIAVILLPFLAIMAIAFYLGKKEAWFFEKTISAKKIANVSLAYLLIIAGALITFALLMPASFKKFNYLYEGTIGYPGIGIILWPLIALNILLIFENLFFKNKFSISILSFIGKFWKKYVKVIFGLLGLAFGVIALNYFSSLDFLHLETVPFDSYQEKIFYEKTWLKKIILEFRPLIFSITPLVFFPLIYLWTKAFFKDIREKLLVFSLSAFIFVFSAAVIQQDLLNIVRYSIILYPLLAILAAIGLDDFFQKKKIPKHWITFGILLLSFASLWQTKPFYLNYSSFLLPQKYIISDSWGYGGYEIAQYLNNLPNPEKLAVWSDNTGVCEFFKGKCIKSNAKEKCKLPDGHDHFNYVIFSRRGETLFFQQTQNLCENTKVFEQIGNLYKNKEARPVFELEINKRPDNFLKVFKVLQ